MAGEDILAMAHGAADRPVQHVSVDGTAFTALWCDDGEWLLIPTGTTRHYRNSSVRVTPEQLEAWRD